MTDISLTLDAADPAEADWLFRELGAELLALDVDRVDLVGEGTAPDQAKGDPAAVTTIIVAVTSSPVLVQLGRVLRDWVNRANGRELTARDGNRSIKIKGQIGPGERAIVDEFFNPRAKNGD